MTNKYTLVTNHCGTEKNYAIFNRLLSCTHYQNYDIVQNITVFKRCKQGFDFFVLPPLKKL